MVFLWANILFDCCIFCMVIGCILAVEYISLRDCEFRVEFFEVSSQVFEDFVYSNSHFSAFNDEAFVVELLDTLFSFDFSGFDVVSHFCYTLCSFDGRFFW